MSTKIDEIKNYIDINLNEYPHLVSFSNGGNLNNLIESLKSKQDIISRLKNDFEPQFNDRWKNEKVTKEEQEEIHEYLKNSIAETINEIMKK